MGTLGREYRPFGGVTCWCRHCRPSRKSRAWWKRSLHKRARRLTEDT